MTTILLINALFTCLGLVSCKPIVPAPPDINPNNPSYSDPINPPKNLSFPDWRAPDPFPSGIPDQPDQCDGNGLDPSDNCLHGLDATGGYLFFDKDSQCHDEQKGSIRYAVWDATTLAGYATPVPDSGEGTRGENSAIFYMGPDFRAQTSRISGNLQRVRDFKTGRTSNKAYITVNCKDTKKKCGTKIPGKPQKGVGGYAWTYTGWWGYYHYITLCPLFFTIDDLSTKLNMVEQELASGSTKMAKDMTWLNTRGSMFLHEMLHTRIADGGVEPWIRDQYVNDVPIDGPRDPKDEPAYGPKSVHKLARGRIEDGGGVRRASQNSDSYVMLANAVW